MAEVLAARAARPDVMKPQKVNGRWRNAAISAKNIARIRKEYLMSGREWKWDIPHKIVERRVPFKGKKRDLRREEKKVEIARCMDRMPKMIEEYRERERKRRRERRKVGLDSIEKLMFDRAPKPGIITR